MGECRARAIKQSSAHRIICILIEKKVQQEYSGSPMNSFLPPPSAAVGGSATMLVMLVAPLPCAGFASAGAGTAVSGACVLDVADIRLLLVSVREIFVFFSRVSNGERTLQNARDNIMPGRTDVLARHG